MSEYLNFYLKSDDKYICLDTFSRSNQMYSIFYNIAEYGDGKPLTRDLIRTVKENIDILIGGAKLNIEKEEENKKLIAEFNNSIEHKLDSIYEIDSCIEENKSKIEELEDDKYFINFLDRIIDNAELDKKFESLKYDLEPEQLIWFGVEWCPDLKETD